MNEVLELGYFWLANVSSTSMGLISGKATDTIATYRGYFAQLVSFHAEENRKVIGGPGVIVEIDESKFGKRKYNRGHRVEGTWVFGGIERTEAKRRFAVTITGRASDDLLPLIREYIHPESIIHSDLWRGYFRIPDELGMEHRTVNHTEGFISPDGVHTNTIEGLWNGFKIGIPARNRTRNDLGEKLLERIWRHDNARDLWGAFLTCLHDTAY